jgi:hypothetical protein
MMPCASSRVIKYQISTKCKGQIKEESKGNRVGNQKRKKVGGAN